MNSEERDRLGRAAYQGPLPWDGLDGWERDLYGRRAEAVRAAVLAGDPYVAALEQLAGAVQRAPAWMQDGEPVIDNREIGPAFDALAAQPEWQQRQEQRDA